MNAGSEHVDGRPDFDSVIEIDDIVVQETDAAGRYRPSNRIGLIGAVDAKHRIALTIVEIHGASTERIGEAAFHHFWQFRPAQPHRGRWGPCGPFGAPPDAGTAIPAK